MSLRWRQRSEFIVCDAETMCTKLCCSRPIWQMFLKRSLFSTLDDVLRKESVGVIWHVYHCKRPTCGDLRSYVEKCKMQRGLIFVANVPFVVVLFCLFCFNKIYELLAFGTSYNKHKLMFLSPPPPHLRNSLSHAFHPHPALTSFLISKISAARDCVHSDLCVRQHFRDWVCQETF